MNIVVRRIVIMGLLTIPVDSCAKQPTKPAAKNDPHGKHTLQLIPINSISDIPQRYRNTPIENLLAYHNLGKPLNPYASAQLLIGMCMDNRKNLTLPDNFAFVIRSGGANLRFSEFTVSYAIAVGGIKYIALIGHDHCGMVNLISKKDQFIQGLVTQAGWNSTKAENQFMHFAPLFEIGNEIDFIASEAKRLRTVYPKIPIAPLLYKIEDNRLYFIKE